MATRCLFLALCATLALQVVAKYRVGWFSSTYLTDFSASSSSVGLFRRCLSQEVTIQGYPAIFKSFCFDWKVAYSHAIRIAVIFSNIAITLVLISIATTALIQERLSCSCTLRRVPRDSAILSGQAMAIAAISSLVVWFDVLLPGGGPKYLPSSSFIMAWLSVATAAVSAVMAHRLHRNLVPVTAPSLVREILAAPSSGVLV